MTTDRHVLDEAIDRVSARLTHVDDDPQFASRIVASLPEQVTWFGWLTYSWAPRLAMMVIVAVATALWTGRRTTEVSPVVSQPVASVVTPVSKSPAVVASNQQPLVPVRPKPLQRLESVEPMAPRPDHEFSLSAVTAPTALAMSELMPDALPAERAIDLAPLQIIDLPLTAESFPQRD